MQLIQIDTLEFWPLQTFIHALLEVFGITLRHPLAGARSYLTAFRRDDESFRIRIKRFGDKQFVSLGSVRVCRVDWLRAELDGALQNFARVLTIGRPPPDPVARQAHRAKSKSIDGQVATDTESGIVDR